MIRHRAGCHPRSNLWCGCGATQEAREADDARADERSLREIRDDR